MKLWQKKGSLVALFMMVLLFSGVVNSLTAQTTSALLVDRTNWQLSASDTSNNYPLWNAVDNAISTRWVTGVAQAPGQWFQVDLGSVQDLSRIVITTTVQKAKAYSLAISLDGTTWGEPVKKGEATQVVDHSFAAPTKVRYFRITLTAASADWWGIADVKAYGLAGAAGLELPKPTVDFEQVQPSTGKDRWTNLRPQGWNIVSKATTSSWTVDTAQKHSGGQALMLLSPQQVSNNIFSDSLPVPATVRGKRYLFSFWTQTKEINGQPQLTINAYANTADGPVLRTTASAKMDNSTMIWTKPWTQVFGKITMPADVDFIEYQIGSGTTIGTQWFDDLSMSELTSTILPEQLSVAPTTKVLKEGGSFNLSATVLPDYSDVAKIVWSSSKPEVATVDAAGKVTAVKEGVALISAATDIGGKTATATVEVRGPGIASVKVDDKAFREYDPLAASQTVTVDGSDFTLRGQIPQLAVSFDAGVGKDAVITQAKTRYGSASVNYTSQTGVKMSQEFRYQRVGDSEVIKAYAFAPEQVTASAFQAGTTNSPEKVLDANYTTRWAMDGDQWIQFDLGSAKSVESVGIAFISGNVRKSSFDLQLSDDGQAWKTVLSAQSSGLVVDNFEVFGFTAQKARFVRILGHGNTANAWNNYAEVRIYPAVDGFDFGVKPQSVKLDKTAASLDINQTVTLIPTVLPANTTIPAVSWKSANPAVAAVDKMGMVRGVSAGTTTISAVTAVGELKANATITVSGRYDARYPAQQFDYIYDGVQLSNGDTFTVTGKERVLIINADISNSGAGKDGILITDSKDVVILKSRIYDMPKGNIGVHLYATASNRTENVTIQDCDIFNIGSDGIKVETANDQDQGKEAYKYSFPIRGVKIVGNRIHEVGMLRSGSPKHGIYGKGENILFENNTILNCYWGSGISARNTAVIRGNVVGNTTGGCIDFWAQTRNGNTDTAIIENNLCYQNATVPAANGTDYAYVFGFSSAPDGDNPDFIIKNYIVRNNTFVATAIANKDYNVVSVRKVYPFQTMVMEGNLYVDPRAKPLYINNKELTSYSGNVEVNTLDVFVNPAIGDYRLKTKGTAGVPGLR